MKKEKVLSSFSKLAEKIEIQEFVQSYTVVMAEPRVKTELFNTNAQKLNYPVCQVGSETSVLPTHQDSLLTYRFLGPDPEFLIW